MDIKAEYKKLFGVTLHSELKVKTQEYSLKNFEKSSENSTGKRKF